MSNTNKIIAAFGLNAFAPTKTTKTTMSDIRKDCITTLEKYSRQDSEGDGLTWARFNGLLALFGGAITPAKALYVAYFGKELGGDVWADVEARWRVLQATSLVYVEELNDRSIGAVKRAEVNKERRKLLFAEVRSLLRYHGINLGRDLTPRDLLAIGEAATKYGFSLDDEAAEVRTAGVTVFIKAVLWGLTARETDSHKKAIDKICSTALKCIEKIRDKYDCIEWKEEDYPCCLKG